MALLFLEGFEGYSSTTAMMRSTPGPSSWANIQVTGATISLNTSYRTAQPTVANSRSLYFSNTSDWTTSYVSIPSSTEVIVGFGFYKNTNSSFWGNIVGICGVTSGSGIGLAVNSANQVMLYTCGSWGAPSVSLGQTASVVLNNYTWHYIEFRAKLSATVGEVEVYIDGVQAMNVSGINTAQGLSDYRSVSFGNCDNNYLYAYYDDIYICDTTGTTNNTFLGPTSVYSLMPTGAGSATEFTATGAASNWEAVDDVTDNGTTDYVASTTTGQKDYYTFESLPGTVTNVSGVQLRSTSTMATSGNRKLKLNVKNGANVVSSALKSLLLGTWRSDTLLLDTAPDGSAWDPTKVNSTEGGIESA